MKLEMMILDASYAVCKLPAQAMIPMWLLNESMVSVTRTSEELSVVCDQELIGDHIDELGQMLVYKDWKCLKVKGPLDFSLVGILSEISQILAKAHVSIFAISTFDTDYILVQNENLEKAIEALRAQDISI